jgi:hypothetical protein
MFSFVGLCFGMVVRLFRGRRSLLLENLALRQQLDLSDVRKEYARKMEFLDRVWDGSAGEVHPGYWLCSVIGAEVHGSELTPLYQQLFSVRAQDFVSEAAHCFYRTLIVER